jgi:DNA-binding Lrp family transcriptional regulator
VSTTDVSEQFNTVSKRTINERLNDLEKRGDIEKYAVGANAVVWYLSVQRVEEASMSRPASDSQ